MFHVKHTSESPDIVPFICATESPPQGRRIGMSLSDFFVRPANAEDRAGLASCSARPICNLQKRAKIGLFVGCTLRVPTPNPFPSHKSVILKPEHNPGSAGTK